MKLNNGTERRSIPSPKLVPLPARSVPPRQMEQQPAMPGGTGETVDYKSTIYTLLDEDNARQVADLTQMTGFPKTTVWRYWTRYHEEHGTRGLARIVAGENGQNAESETA